MTEVNRDSEKQFLSPETKKEIKKFFNFAKEKLQSLTIQGEKIEDKFNNFFSLLENLQESDIGKFENVDNLLKDLQRLTTEIENIIILIEKDGDNLNVMDLEQKISGLENELNKLIEKHKVVEITEDEEKVIMLPPPSPENIRRDDAEREESGQNEKGFFSRIKRKLFTKEGRQETKENVKEVGRGLLKALPGMAYKTSTSVFGVKLVTDAIGLFVDKVSKGEKGWGDYAKIKKNKKEREEIAQTFKEVFEEILAKNSLNTDNATTPEQMTEVRGKIEAKVAKLNAKIDASQASSEDKAKLKQKIHEIISQDELLKAENRQETTEKVAKIIETYTDNKLSLITVLKDILNFAGVAAGAFALRGVAYLGTSVAERVRTNRVENKKKELEDRETEKVNVMRDLLLNSAIETLRGLGFQGIKKDRTTFEKGTDFIKSVGTILRGLGIYGVAFGDTDVVGAFERFKENIEEHGLGGAVVHNFVDNFERVFHISNDEEFQKAFAIQSEEAKKLAENMGLSSATSIAEHQKNLANFAGGIGSKTIGSIGEHVGSGVDTSHLEHVGQSEEVEVEQKPQIFDLKVEKGGSVWGTLDKALLSDSAPQEFKDLFAGDKHAFAEWREKQLEDMGFVKVKGHWGSPFTVHAGAEMKVYLGEDGEWHARFDKDLKVLNENTHKEYRTINVHKTLHFQEAEQKLEHQAPEVVPEKTVQPIENDISKLKVSHYDGKTHPNDGIPLNKMNKLIDRGDKGSSLPDTNKYATVDNGNFPVNSLDHDIPGRGVADIVEVSSSPEQEVLENNDGKWTSSDISAKPTFFDEKEVANRQIQTKVEVNSGGTDTEVGGNKSQASGAEKSTGIKLADHAGKTGNVKDLDIGNASENTRLAEEELKPNKQIKLAGSFVTFHDEEAYLLNTHISKYKYSTLKDYEPERSRKILLNKKQIAYLTGKMQEKGLTIVPLSVYTKGRKIKVEIGIGRGKKQYDKKRVLKERQEERDMRRALKGDY